MSSRSKRRRRVLGASCILAALIVASTSFAWFSSKDEVTNRLTATADYGVSVVEDFTPPKDLVPGQKVNKDVSAVNTGNVDAYVRLAILNDLQLNVNSAGVAVDSAAAALPSFPQGDKGFVELQLTAVDAQLPTETENAVKKVPNSVSTIQAGGTLVWTPDGAVQPTDAQSVSPGDDVTQGADDYDGADQFIPTKTGLYIFRRTVKGTPTYAGYFFVKGSGGAADKYYALVTEEDSVNISGATITEGDGTTTPVGVIASVSGVKLATTKDVTIANDSNTADLTMKWYKSAPGTAAAAADVVDAGADTAKWIQVSVEEVTGKPILINIELDANWATNWTYVQGTDATDTTVDNKNDIGYFYYKKVLAAGYTTEKLVDSVTIDKNVTQGAYNDLVYDLTVVLNSTQVTKNEVGEYTNETITGWVGSATVATDTGAPTWAS